MALELSVLAFKTETSDLERASKIIGTLVQDVAKLDKASKDVARTEATLAKAAKDSAKANLDNAKAQQVNIKAIEATEKVQNKSTAATQKNISMLQRQTDIYDFLAQGYSKGQAGILATAKATGQFSKELENVLKLQKQFTADPFDKSDRGLDRMTRTLKELKQAQDFVNQGMSLTTKQSRELSNDLSRLEANLKRQGKSYDEINRAQAVYRQQFNEEANALNRSQAAMDAVTKQRKEVVSATNYLTQADQKMTAALSTSNMALDKAGTDSLVKYETALRKSGLTQDAVTQKLATYKVQLAQVQAQEMKRREQHLARAAAPQITDIGVSLYSGQAPLTVLLQQSGQLVDLLNLSGVEAAKFGEILRTSFYSMIPAIKQVGLGIAGLVGGLFMDAGSAVTRFVGNVSGITAAMEIAKRAIVSGGEANFKYIASLEKFGKVASTVAATGIAALIAGVILLGLEYKKIIKAESELTKALATSGGALGISKTEAVAAAEGMASLGVGTLKAVAAITEIAKAGNIGKESLELITKSAIDLEKTAGISIEETAKQFAKLQEEPSKALTEIAQKTGLVDKATLDYVYALEQQGDKTEAARVATLALASANAQVAAEVRDNWSPIEVLWNDIKSAIGSVKQEIYDLTTSNAVVGALRTVWETVAVVISEVWFTIKGVGKEIGGIGAQIAAVMQGDFSGAAEIGRQMKTDAASAAEEQKKYVAAILNRTNVEQKSFNQSKEQNSQYAKWRKENDQALDKSISKADKYKAKELEVQKAVLAGTVSQIEADKALAGWKKIILGEEKTKKDPSENYYATLMREATNNTIAANTAAQELTKSEQKLLEVRADPRFEKLNAIQKQDVVAKYESAIAAEKQTAFTEKLADAEEHRLKLLGKSEGIGKQYYSDMQKLEEFAKVAGWSRSEVEELTRAIFMSTPAWKAYEKALEDVNSAARKFNEDSLASQASTLKENESLDYRLSLLGKTTEEQKALSIEYNRANKLREVDIKLAKQLRDIEEKIAKAKKDGLPESDYKALVDAEVQARKDAAEQAKAINREVAVQYAEDLQREIDAIKNGISDSIVTALFEGGKAGSQKLRSVLMDALKKPVTMVVNAVVNTLFGSVLGSLFGGGAGAAGAVAGGSNIVGMASNGLSLANMVTSGYAGSIGSAVGSIFGQTAGNAALASSLGLGSSSAAAAASGASVAAGGTGAGAGLGASLGAAVPYIAVAAIVAMSWKKLFGRSLKDSGIQGEFGGESGFEGQQYNFYKGGLFRSDKTELGPLDEAMRKTLADSFKMMKKQVVDFAEVLGFSADKLDSFSSSIKLSLKGLSEQDANAKIQEAIATVNNEMAQEILGTWTAVTKEVDKVIWQSATVNDSPTRVEKELVESRDYTPSEFAREGEKAIDTLTRLATSLSTVNTTFKNFGWSLYEASLAGASASSKFIDLFGTMENFTQAASTYYENFYSEGEKAANSTRDIAEALAKVGLEMPTTREGFRALVEQQMKLGESGVAAVAALLGVNSAFFGVTERLTGLTNETKQLEIELLRASGKVAEADALLRKSATEGFNAAELAAYDYNEALKKQIQTINSATDDAYKALERAVDAQRKILNETITNLRAVFDAVKKAAKSLYGEVNSVRKQSAVAGNAFINQALQDLKNSGVLPDRVKLQDAIDDTMQGLSSEVYDSAFEAQRSRLVLAGKLTQIADLTEPQLTVAEKQLEDLDGILEAARKQIDELRGINTSVLSVKDAIANLAAAMVAEKKGVAVLAGGGGSSGSSGSAAAAAGQAAALGGDLYKDIVNHGKVNGDDAYYLIPGFNDFATKKATNEHIASLTGMSVAEVWGLQEGGSEAYWQAVQGAYDSGAVVRSGDSLEEVLAKLPKLSVGTNYVERSGAAYIHEGEAVVPKAFNPWSGGTSMTSDDTAVEIRALREENKAQALAMVQLQSRLTKIIERWDGNGMPEPRVV